MAEPTKGPWKVQGTNVMADGWCVAVCGGRSANREPLSTQIHEENYANAEFIAHTRNTYDTLHQELSLLLRLLEPYEQDGTLSERVPGLATLNGIREALRKAEVSASR